MSETRTSKPRPEPRHGYRVFRTIPTRWEDNDVYGHVNNVVYYSRFDTAVNAYLIEQGALDVHCGTVIGLVVETQCNYFAPISFPQTVEAVCESLAWVSRACDMKWASSSRAKRTRLRADISPMSTYIANPDGPRRSATSSGPPCERSNEVENEAAGDAFGPAAHCKSCRGWPISNHPHRPSMTSGDFLGFSSLLFFKCRSLRESGGGVHRTAAGVRRARSEEPRRARRTSLAAGIMALARAALAPRGCGSIRRQRDRPRLNLEFFSAVGSLF
jgi:hypothetical protein